MKTVLVFGTFDFLHAGHMHLLHEARNLGKRLVVSIARDNIVKEIKNIDPIHDEEERKALVEVLEMVDEVVLGDEELSSYQVLERVQPDIIALGYDQMALKEDLEKHEVNAELIVIGAYKPAERKSSAIKRAMQI